MSETLSGKEESVSLVNTVGLALQPYPNYTVLS